MSKGKKRTLALLLTAIICLFAVTALAAGMLTLPGSLRVIKDEAFYGAQSIDTIVLPENVEEIGSRAFADSTLEAINLPRTITYIADDAFDGCGELDITVEEGCYAYYWCVSHNLIEGEIPLIEIVCSAGEAYVGDTLTWTAEAKVGLAPYRYLFELYRDGEKVETRAYSDENTYSSLIAIPGTYQMLVKAKDDDGEIYEQWTAPMQVGLKPLMVSAVTCDLDQIQTTQTATWTASADGGQKPYSYAFELTLDGAVVASQAYSESNTFSYTFDSEGVYALNVTVQDATGTVSEKHTVSVPVNLRALEILSMTADKASCQTEETITFTVTAEGGKAPYSYAFEVIQDGVSLGKSAAQAENVYAYIPQTVGTYTMIAHVTDAYGTTVQMTSAEIPVSLMPLAVQTVVPVEEWVKVGNPIEWTTTAIGGVKPLRYAFDVFLGEDEMDGRAFREGENTFAYTPDTAGVYSVNARVRDAANTTVELKGGEVNVYDTISIAAITPESENIVAGHIARWTIEVNGGKGVILYDYKVYYGDELAFTAQAKTSNIVEYVPMHSGSYTIEVVATDENGEFAQMTSGAITVEAAPATAAEYFTVEQIAGNFGRITKYTGPDTAVVVPGEIGDYIIEEIGANAFLNNTSLVSVALPESIRRIQSNAFNGCTELQGIDLNKVETIGDRAFRYCYGLKKIVLPEGLTQLVSAVFEYCTNLESVSIPDSVTYIGPWTFNGCSSLKKVNYPMGWKTAGESIFRGTKVTTMSIPEGITTIPANAFMGCTNFSKIELPSTLESIPANAFNGCSGLTEIHIPENVTSIGDRAFRYCSGLKKIVLPEGLTQLVSAVFEYCTGLESVSISDSVTYVGPWTFNGCSNLIEVNYPMGWKTAGESIFQGTAIKTIEIPEGVTSIPANAFRYCMNFTHFELPSTIETIGDCAFAGCTGLTSFEVPEKVNTINYGAFYNCTGLVSVSLPSGLITIGDDSFEYCSRLKELNLPEGLERINYRAFGGCTSLISV